MAREGGAEVTSLRVLTPTYDGRVAGRHAVVVAQILQDCGLQGSPVQFEGIDQSAGHLITNRNVLLTQALAGSADLALWMDADCAVTYVDPRALYRFIDAAKQPGVAIVGAACARRVGGGRNVLPLEHEEQPRPSHYWSPFEVRAVGLGVALYNLRWWRAAFARAGFRGVDGAVHFYEWRDGVTEDYRACEWARDHGGLVLVDPRIGTWHDGLVVEANVGKVLQ